MFRPYFAPSLLIAALRSPPNLDASSSRFPPPPTRHWITQKTARTNPHRRIRAYIWRWNSVAGTIVVASPGRLAVGAVTSILIFPCQHVLESVTFDGQDAQVDREFRRVQMIGRMTNRAYQPIRLVEHKVDKFRLRISGPDPYGQVPVELGRFLAVIHILPAVPSRAWCASSRTPTRRCLSS